MDLGKDDTGNEHRCSRCRDRYLDCSGSCRYFCFHFTDEANEGQKGETEHSMPCHPGLVTTKLMHVQI